MKHARLIRGAVLVTVLGLGGTLQATGTTPYLLSSGYSHERLVPSVNVDRYSLTVDAPTHFRIASEGRDVTGVNMRLNARLLDQSNRRVIVPRYKRGHFLIETTLQPGNYLLEVKAVTFGRRHERLNRYKLKTLMY